VFHTHAGKQAAIDEVSRRSGTWFDPAMVAAVQAVASRDSFWVTLASPVIETRVVRLLPAAEGMAVDDDYLDAIAAAFGQVIDAKSPYTSGHSERVGQIADKIARTVGMPERRCRWLRRAALLHDVGKLGVPNTILDKPAALDEQEWVEMRMHAAHTREILGRIGVFGDLADVAAAHHERLDGRGYPLGLREGGIPYETRIITVCDFYDALTADRPYRGALPVDEALRIMGEEVGKAIDPECFEALRSSVQD
jgi:putative nucleotidyltransferase with HDIG domain